MIYWTVYAGLVRMARRLRQARLRLVARRMIVARAPKAFISHPEPKTIGSFARGQQLVAGNFQFSGNVIEAPGRPIWAISQEPHIIEEIQGCAWIDDLAATGTAAGQRTLQGWIAEWIRLYGGGSGPGWRPDLTGQRLTHWISHAITIMRGQDKRPTEAFLRSVARQSNFLARTWRSAPKGLPRFQALTGLIYASLAIEGMEGALNPNIRRIGKECAKQVRPDGSLDSRNPEDLMEVFSLLVWAKLVLEETGHSPDPRHVAAIERIAPTLRNLRIGDGGLVRFHGGGRGSDGKLDQALAESGVRTRATTETRMGFARLASGRSIVVLDAAAPAAGSMSARAHASTLAFEMSSGRHPLITSVGPGRLFGADWERDARETYSHTTLTVHDMSSSEFWKSGYAGDTFGQRLSRRPAKIKLDRANDVSGIWVLASHGGYVPKFGLTHERRLYLSPDGRDFRGEDTLRSEGPTAFRTLHEMQEQLGGGVRFALHFHLHPDVTASLDMSGHAVSLKLPSEEVWVFRQSGGEMALEDSAYLDPARLRPRSSLQIVVRSTVADDEAQVTWALTRAQEGNRYSAQAVMNEELEPLV